MVVNTVIRITMKIMKMVRIEVDGDSEDKELTRGAYILGCST